MRSATRREVVIVEAVRTGVGRGHPTKGQFRDIHPNELLGVCFSEIIARSGIAAGSVDDVLVGCVQQLGEQAWNVGRNAWLQAGLPIEVPATTIDRQCGSSQQALNFATATIGSGLHEIAIAAGVESMSHLPFSAGVQAQEQFGDAVTTAMQERYGLPDKQNMIGQGQSAEGIADRWNISREELDELALRSHQLAAAATAAGAFKREIVPVKIGEDDIVADQGIRPETSREALAALPPVFRADGKTTAGSSSQVSDGAAALLLMSAEKAKELGLRPRARIIDVGAIGSDPLLMLTGPIPLTQEILSRNGLSIRDIGVVEMNEAFASVLGAWLRETKAPLERVNPRGGAIALGHPLGATGARLLTTILHELEDLDEELGLVAMCCGGGLATATLIERL